ncbi:MULTISPECIES: YqbH/XkdH family protein [Bacillus]|uniref:YqbH/XkdH family protein n=1 Tax=Bacillus TaxID=1386 RepID=UPI001CDD85DB|nr:MULTISPECIES: YqbH/XkdH family protein [Bacillus]MCY7766611.1 YqbH/XkdH family protein [Bacillus inaquosorum]MCY7964588.1 YqbH/XkdH family protein [Bacillus inaquosorum]MCY8237345.1 YqbH/XkdH family protein [Bacillus inaquosorum]MCY8722198.1 YqbH/XkdH family protein [Bacillus inaquosorum]MCY9097223.1 YqbH/XkdH family protein [Bacillus inaquosorum]
MSYQRMLIHRCDIYHEATQAPSAGRFGIPADKLQPVTSYPDTPDEQDVPCYFTEKTQQLIQEEPDQTVYHSFLVHFPLSADIRVNDKIIWENHKYILKLPKRIRHHHWEVIAVRDESL